MENSLRSDPLIEGSRFPRLASMCAWKSQLLRPLVQPYFRARVHAALAGLEHGEVRLFEGSERHVFGRPTDELPLSVSVHVRDAAMYPRVALNGTIGAAEAYVQGWWSTDDLTGMVRLLVRNREAMGRMEGGVARALAPLQRLRHRRRDNTPAGSRRNIEAHYDLGNDFYALFLDPTMMYSAGIFEREDATLEAASIAKIERLCKKLELRASDHLLEIGTGWGGFALHAARTYGCRVTTTTISPSQHAYATARVREAGLADRVTVLLKDYRHLDGVFDKLVSIEMIEAVGHRWYDTFFGCCARLLKRDGVMALQAITIDDRLYESALRNVDFIQRYVFPGSSIPSVGAICASVARSGDLRLFHHEDLTPHYARTLAAWRERFLANRERVHALGFDERFVRLWEFYLCYCEGGFTERAIGSVQMVFTKPGSTRAPLLGTLA